MRGTFPLAVAVMIAATINAQQVVLPFVGCQTEGQTFIEAPAGRSPSITLPAAAASQLSYYKSANGLAVLAPRGWHCLGTVGSGGTQLFATPEPINEEKYFSTDWQGFRGPVVYLVRRFGDTSGRFNVAEVIMRVFPAHKSFAESVAAEFDFVQRYAVGPYAGDKLTYKGTATVEYTTPAGVDGLGTYWGVQKGESPIEGVAILSEQTPPDLLLLSVRLPNLPQGVAASVRQVEQDAQRVFNLPPR